MNTVSRNETYAFDNQAGPICGLLPISHEDAAALVAQRDIPHIICFVVWPYPESPDQRPVRRNYYALNLPQAVARATEVEIRLREQELRAALACIRPATSDETNLFFRAMDRLEDRLPIPVSEQDLVKESGFPLRNTLCERDARETEGN